MQGGGYLFNSSLAANFSWQIIYGEVIANERTNDQIMSRWGGSSLNDKYIFQYPEHCKSSMEN